MNLSQTIVEIASSEVDNVLSALNRFGAERYDNDTLVSVPSDDKDAIYDHLTLSGFNPQFFNISE